MNIEVVGMDCCGCRSCEQACPKQCIKMIDNDEGFIYPKVEISRCINCELCLKKCPIYTYQKNEKNILAFALMNKDKSIMKSASGGACTVISKSIISDGGIVYGVTFDDKFNAIYTRVSNIKDLKKIQSSKYVFSDTNISYKSLKEDLKNNIKVLFIGLPCQVAGLLSFLGKEYDNLYTISLICHGVPSPKYFREYIKYKQKKLKNLIVEYDFRSKEKYGWGLNEKILLASGKTTIKNLSYTSYGHDFLLGNSYRENCYNCKFANKDGSGDITVGDFWGIDELESDLDVKKGISCVLVKTSKGKQLLNSVLRDVTIREYSFNDVAKRNHNLCAPSKRPIARNDFYDFFNDDIFAYLNKKEKKFIIPNIIRRFVPRKIKIMIKKLLNKIN